VRRHLRKREGQLLQTSALGASTEKAEAALEVARREHDENAALIERDRQAVERRAEVEEKRWQKMKSRLKTTVEYNL